MNVFFPWLTPNEPTSHWKLELLPCKHCVFSNLLEVEGLFLVTGDGQYLVFSLCFVLFFSNRKHFRGKSRGKLFSRIGQFLFLVVIKVRVQCAATCWEFRRVSEVFHRAIVALVLAPISALLSLKADGHGQEWGFKAFFPHLKAGLELCVRDCVSVSN